MADSLTRSQLARLTSPGSFWWATGIEDTFITAPHPVTSRTLDEYELTGHYERWRDDLDLMASLGVPAARCVGRAGTVSPFRKKRAPR